MLSKELSSAFKMSALILWAVWFSSGDKVWISIQFPSQNWVPISPLFFVSSELNDDKNNIYSARARESEIYSTYISYLSPASIHHLRFSKKVVIGVRLMHTLILVKDAPERTPHTTCIVWNNRIKLFRSNDFVKRFLSDGDGV